MIKLKHNQIFYNPINDVVVLCEQTLSGLVFDTGDCRFPIFVDYLYSSCGLVLIGEL